MFSLRNNYPPTKFSWTWNYIYTFQLDVFSFNQNEIAVFHLRCATMNWNVMCGWIKYTQPMHKCVYTSHIWYWELIRLTLFYFKFKIILYGTTNYYRFRLVTRGIERCNINFSFSMCATDLSWQSWWTNEHFHAAYKCKYICVIYAVNDNDEIMPSLRVVIDRTGRALIAYARFINSK